MACELKNKTDNPICSDSLQDLKNNAIIMDQYINSEEFEVPDRLGIPRKTWAGLEKDVQDALANLDPRLEQLIAEKIIAQGGVEIANDWGDSLEKVINQDFITNNLGYVTPEMFGAVGDGVNDDADALELAINSGRLVLMSAKSIYRLGRTVISNKNIFINGNNAKIIANYEDLDRFLMRASGNEYYLETTLIEKQYINNNEWVVADATGVEVGDLMEIVSSVSWYTDPRPGSTDSRKSELHLITSVNGNTITSEIPSNDGYLHDSSERVNVSFRKPTRACIDGFRIEISKQPITSDRVSPITALNITGAVRPIIKNIAVSNSVSSGIQVTLSYAPIVFLNKVYGSNDYYTGYGIQFGGCTIPSVFENNISGSRRGIDFSGGNVITLMPHAFKNIVTSSGSDSRGRRYGWSALGTGSYCSGIGTHGACDKAVIEGNLFINLHDGVLNRSPNTTVRGNEYSGRFLQGVDNAYGWGVSIVDNFNSGTYDNKSTQRPVGSGNINSQYIREFVRFQDTWRTNIVSNIERNTVSVNDSFVSYLQNINTININIFDNTIDAKPTISADGVFLLKSMTGITPDIWWLGVKGNTITGRGQVSVLKWFSDNFINANFKYTYIDGVSGDFTPVIESEFGVSGSSVSRTSYTFDKGLLLINTLINHDNITTNQNSFIRFRLSSIPFSSSVEDSTFIGSCNNNYGGSGAIMAVSGKLEFVRSVNASETGAGSYFTSGQCRIKL